MDESLAPSTKKTHPFSRRAWIIGAAIALSFAALIAGLKYPRETPIMPRDMPPDFNFIMRYGHGGQDQIDTFKKTCQKDLVMDGVATAPLTLSASEMKKIYAKFQSINLLIYPRQISIHNFFPWRHPEFMGYYYVKIQAGGQTKEVKWSGIMETDNPKYNRFRETIWEIHKIIQENEEYKKLPPAKGGYL